MHRVAFWPITNSFNNSDQTSPTPSGILLSGRGEPAAATAARRHHHLHHQASNADSRLQRSQRAGASSANQGRRTHQPTKQLCLNLQSLAKQQAHYGRRPTRSAKRARRATGAKSTGVQPSASPRGQQHGQHNARVQRVPSTTC